MQAITVAQYFNFSNPATTGSAQSATPAVIPVVSDPAPPANNTQYGGNTIPIDTNQTYADQTSITQQNPVIQQPAPVQPFGQIVQQPVQGQVPEFNPPFNVPAFDPYAGINFEIPVFEPPQLYPAQGGEAPELLALGGGISNAYTNPFNGMGQTGGAVPAFQQPGIQESLANQGLVVRERERLDDRKIADQKYIDLCEEIRDSKNKKAWMSPLPPYTGPLENRTNNDPGISLSSFLSHTVKQDDYEYLWEQPEKHYFDFSMLDPTRFGERVKVWVGLGPDEEKARKHMEKALQLMAKGEHIKAAKEFEWAAYYWQETTVEEDARYHAAECYYREKRFNDAVKQYTKLLTDFPNSQYKAEAIKNTYEIAKTWLKQATEDNVSYVNVSDKSRPTFDTFGHAENALKAVFINCPNDPMADSCVFLIAVGYMKRGRAQGDASFERAAENFMHLRDCYPNSKHLVDAMQLEVICRQKAGLGAAYDPRHVNEAGKLAEQLMGQFETQLPPEQRNEIVQILNQLTEDKAAKLWDTGQFYDSRKDYLAARLHYRKIINEYPATEHAEKARLRYEQIRDLPDELPSDVERIKSFLRLGRKS